MERYKELPEPDMPSNKKPGRQTRRAWWTGENRRRYYQGRYAWWPKPPMDKGSVFGADKFKEADEGLIITTPQDAHNADGWIWPH